MMKTRHASAILAALLALAACNSRPAAGGLSPDEERELDNAAAMLDDNTIFDASPDSLAANTADATAPANAAGPATDNRSGNAH